LPRRIYEHRIGAVPGFTRRHNVKLLVYLETYDDIEAAIVREKRLKEWQRDWKIRLIERDNPDWNDLAVALLGFEPLPADLHSHRHPGESGTQEHGRGSEAQEIFTGSTCVLGPRPRRGDA
jgi:putative endonuclease